MRRGRWGNKKREKGYIFFKKGRPLWAFIKNKLGMRSLHTQRLTRDGPCPVQVDKEVSWCGWWSRTVMVGATGPRRWPGSQQSSQAGCGRSDQSAQTLWLLWIQCGWLLQTTLQHLCRREVDLRKIFLFFFVWLLKSHSYEANRDF